jgi:hypothetical protein
MPRRRLRHASNWQTPLFRIHLNLHHIVPVVIEAQPNFVLGLRLIANVAGFKELLEIEIKNTDEMSRILWAFLPRQAQPERTLTQRNLATRNVPAGMTTDSTWDF